MGHQVFISYSSKDKKVGDATCAMLERRGYRCWIAPRDIVPGKEWGEAIVEGIRNARIFVLIFSANANQSPQVRREVERAVHHGLPVIPFRIEDVPPASSLEYFMSAPHWLDALTPPLERHLDHLADAVGRLLGDEAAGGAVTAPPTSHAQGLDRQGLVRAVGAGALFAAAPLAATLAHLEPPWPSGIGWLSAAFVLAAPLAARELPHRVRPSRGRAWRLSAWLLTVAGLLGYLILYSMFVETMPASGFRAVRGYQCTQDALLVYKEACPDLPRDALRDAEWESATLWTRSSVTVVRIALVGVWLAFVAGLAVAAASMARRR